MFFFKKKRLAIYTAIIGRYDFPITPSYVDENCDYFCFTDNSNLTSDFWNIIYISSDICGRKLARKIKILPHIYLKQYSESIWIDANFRIKSSMYDFISTYSTGRSMICMMHPERDCIYDEAIACIEQKKDSPEVINRQIAKYKSELFPHKMGLISSGILYRRHSKLKVKHLMKDWWTEVNKESGRDQLSFNYVCWKNKFLYDIADILYYKNDFFEYYPHYSNFNVSTTFPIEYSGFEFHNTSDSDDIKIFVDTVNKISFQDSIPIIYHNVYTELMGWTLDISCKMLFKCIWLQIDDFFIEGNYFLSRPDVSAELNCSSLENSGFCVQFPTHLIKPNTSVKLRLLMFSTKKEIIYVHDLETVFPLE